MNILRPRSNDLQTGVYNGTIIGIVLWAILLGCILVGQALAVTPPTSPDSTSEATVQSYIDSDATSAAMSGSESNLNAPTSIESRETHIGVAMASPIPAQVTECFRPKDKLGRGWRFLFGAVEVSATVELDATCLAAKQAADERQLALIQAQIVLLQAQAEADRAIAERLQTEEAFEEDQDK